jgi:hypothetical protein
VPARIILIAAMVALHLLGSRSQQFHLSFALHLVASGAFMLALLAVVKRQRLPGFGEAFGIALLLRLIALPLAPVLSDDFHRYMFEGRLVLEGVNPYLTPPSADSVFHLRGPTWHLINNPDIPAAYPPAMQGALALGVLIADGALGMKLVFGFFDLLIFVALWLGLPRLGVAREMAVAYGWCPLVILEFAGEGHGDSLAVLLLVLAVLVRGRGQGLLSGAALAGATAAKLMPVVLLPFLLRRSGSWRLDRAKVATVLPSFLIVLTLFYLPFLAPPGEMFRGTLEYAGRWRSNDSLFVLIHWMTESWFVRDTGGPWLQEAQRLSKLPLALLGIGVLTCAWLRRLPVERAAWWFFLFFVAAAPTMHPWYLAFLVPWLCLWPNPGLLAFTGTVYLAYHVLPGWIESRVWEEKAWVKVVEYLPFYLGIIWLSRQRGER